MSRTVDSVVVRRARSADRQDIARLVLLSAPHFLPAVFGPGVQRAVEDLAAGPGTLFGCEHTWIAESRGTTRGMLLGYTGAVKQAQDLRTGLSLLRLLRADMILRLGALLRMQSTIGRIGRDEYYISNVAVYPDCRGQGIGEMLIERARAEAAEAGMRSLVLDVETDNPDAQRLYERLGFRVAGETPPATLGGRPFVFRRMEAALEPAHSPRLESR